MIKTAVT